MIDYDLATLDYQVEAGPALVRVWESPVTLRG